jgi:hypothetical protein
VRQRAKKVVEEKRLQVQVKQDESTDRKKELEKSKEAESTKESRKEESEETREQARETEPQEVREEWTKVVRKGRKVTERIEPEKEVPREGSEKARAVESKEPARAVEKKEPTKAVEKKEPARIAEKREPKTTRRRGAAIIVRSVEVEGKRKTYSEVLRALKEKLGRSPEIGVRGIRETRRGEVLLVLEKGEDVNKAREMIKEKTGEVMEVTRAGDRIGVRVRGMDDSEGEREIEKAVMEAVEGGEPKVVRMYRYKWNERGAIVSMKRKEGEELLRAGKVRVGWVSCRTSLVELGPPRCYVCKVTGHLARTCTENRRENNKEDRRKCFVCRQTGHLARVCPASADVEKTKTAEPETLTEEERMKQPKDGETA